MEEHLLQDGGIIGHFRILGQKTDLHIGITDNPAGIRLQAARQNPQKGGLAGAVNTDDTHLVIFIQIEIHIGEQLLHPEIDGKALC